MKLTIDDLKSAEMPWEDVSFYKLESFTDFLNGCEWIKFGVIKDRINMIFGIVSQKTGIDIKEIKNYYLETFEILSSIFDEDSSVGLVIKKNQLYIKILDSALKVPNVSAYIEKKRYKSPERIKKENLLTLWHNYNIEEQQIVLVIFAGVLGIGSNNGTESEWRKKISINEATCIDNFFYTVTKNINQPDYTTKEKAKKLLIALDYTTLSYESLSEIIDHVKKDYTRRMQKDRNQIFEKQPDSSMEDLLLLLETVLKYQFIYNLDLEKAEIESKQVNLEREGAKYLSTLMQRQQFRNLTTPLLTDAWIVSPVDGDTPDEH